MLDWLIGIEREFIVLMDTFWGRKDAWEEGRRLVEPEENCIICFNII